MNDYFMKKTFVEKKKRQMTSMATLDIQKRINKKSKNDETFFQIEMI